jgi:hypothetical protein
MAIYHLHAKFTGRSGGKSAVASAAYRSTENLYDEEAAQNWNYTNKEKSEFSKIILPPTAPERLSGRGQLWNEVQKTEGRKNSQFSREFDVALPNGLNTDQKIKLVDNFSQQFIDRGLIVDYSIHKAHKDNRYVKEKHDNDHFHLAHTLRPIDNTGKWDKHKDREIVSEEKLKEIRKSWADIVNQMMKDLGRPDRIDHRTLQEQGITDRPPQQHQGPTAFSIEMQGKASQRGRSKKIDMGEIKEIKEMVESQKEPDIKEFDYNDEMKKLDLSEQQLKTTKNILQQTPGEWNDTRIKFEKYFNNQELKAEALATKEKIPTISEEWQRDIRNSEADKTRIEREKPRPIYEIKDNPLEKLKSKFMIYQDDSGKNHEKYNDYFEAQTKIIKKWEYNKNQIELKGQELKTEQNLIIQAKSQEPDYNKLLKLSRYEKQRRPRLFESIQNRAKLLLDTAKDFIDYRILKKSYEEVKAAREETARRQRQERTQKRGRDQGYSR